MRPRGGIAVVVTIAVALVMGLIEYHRVLDPTHAERNGVTLNLLVDSGNGVVPNDWYTAGSAHVTSRRGVVLIVAEFYGWALESRIVHVFANDCYRVEVRASAIDGTAVLVAYDAELTRFRAYTALPDRMKRSAFVVSAPDQRITFAVAATMGTHIALAGVRLLRLAHNCHTPLSGRDIGLVLNRLRRS